MSTKPNDTADQKRLRDEVLEQIGAIMKAANVGGVVMLASQQSAAWRFVIPEWAGIVFEDRGLMRVRINSKTPEAKQHGDETMHLIASMRDMSRDVTEAFGRTFRMVRESLRLQGATLEHTGFGNEPDQRPFPGGGKES